MILIALVLAVVGGIIGAAYGFWKRARLSAQRKQARYDQLYSKDHQAE